MHKLRQILLSKDTLTFLLFLITSAAIWFGHAMTSVRNARVPVHISYVGLPEGIAMSDSTPDHVMITVRDAGRRLLAFNSTRHEIEVDVRPQIKGKQGEIRLSSESMHQSITTLLPGTSKLQQIEPEQIIGHYDAATKKEAEAPKEEMTEKKISIIVKGAGVPHGRKMRFFPAKVDVSVQVPLSRFSEVTEDDIEAICDYPKSAADEQAERLTVRVKSKKEFIENARAIPGSVEFIIEQ